MSYELFASLKGGDICPITVGEVQAAFVVLLFTHPFLEYFSLMVRLG